MGESEQAAANGIKISPAWYALLRPAFEAASFQQLRQFLHEEKNKGLTIYPPGSQIFAAFSATAPEQVKVVIIGQDPYHGPGQANGLCFSVNRGIRIPPSLLNIYKEIQADLNLPIPTHGDLSSWAAQGVLLLNATLTVRAGQAGSHQNKGWEIFTDEVIRLLANQYEGLVFLLWGKFAQGKAGLIPAHKHLILQSAHPSPLAGGAFFGNHHFSQTNQYLQSQGKTPIDWSVQ